MSPSDVETVMSDDDIHPPWAFIETTMSESLGRLRWSVFEDVSKIRVVDDAERPTPEFSPFDGHPIAAEAASKIPLHWIAFTMLTLDEYEASEYEAPDRLLVRRADGGVITVADVVAQLSAYFIAHKEEIVEAKEPFLNAKPRVPYQDISADTRVFFDGFYCGIEPEIFAVQVELWAEGEYGESCRDHWNHDFET